MAEKPKTMELMSESLTFVFSHMQTLVAHLAIIFPLLLILQTIDNYADTKDADYVSYITLLPQIFLYGCFALSWHRLSLAGINQHHVVNPFRYERKDLGFMGVFFGMTFFSFVVGLLFGALLISLFLFCLTQMDVADMTPALRKLVAGISAKHPMLIKNPELSIGAACIALPVSIYALVQLIRMSFKLPARSLDVKITFKDAKQASRGLISKIIWAEVIIFIAFYVLVFIYALIVGITLKIITEDTEPSTVGTLFTMFVMGTPVLFFMLVYIAINITLISKAYQWGMKHNAAEPA